MLAKVTKSESKTQLHYRFPFINGCCHCWPKLQNLKAKHNKCAFIFTFDIVAIAGQSYKIWKQNTTTKMYNKRTNRCHCWPKLQNLKAKHNIASIWLIRIAVAIAGQSYKIWKQNTTGVYGCVSRVCCHCWPKLQNLKAKHNIPHRNHIYRQLPLLAKVTKSESKTQPRLGCVNDNACCHCWPKLQNLKANHNNVSLQVQNVSSCHCWPKL